jgi:hypothetical protein
VGLALLAVTAAPAAADDKPEVVTMGFVETGGKLAVSTSVSRLFDTAAFDALDSGFPSLVVLRIWVYPVDSRTPVALQVLQREVIYDLWDDTFTLRLDDLRGRRTVNVRYRAEALRLLTSLDQVTIASTSQVAYDQHHVLEIVAELNPVSRETLAQARRWLTQGGGGLGGGSSFFGSFVSVFMNMKVPDADRVLRLRSQPFYRPRPDAP